VQALEDQAAWCLEKHGVRFVASYFSADKTRMICVYEAPDAESVRTANRVSGVPFDRVWAGEVFGPGTC
jgi:hypothetical protein